MDWDLKITDLEGSTPEHSAVIVNFVAAVRHQLKNSTCYVYSDNVQYLSLINISEPTRRS